MKDAVADYLRSHSEEAFFLGEVATQLRVREPDLEAAIGELEAQREVCVGRYPLADPHLPSELVAVTWAGTDVDCALARLDGTFNRWLRAFLAGHRCT